MREKSSVARMNAKPGHAIVPVRAESCDECVFYNGARCVNGASVKECSEFDSQFTGYVYKVVELTGADRKEEIKKFSGYVIYKKAREASSLILGVIQEVVQIMDEADWERVRKCANAVEEKDEKDGDG